MSVTTRKIVPERVDAVLERCRREVDEGLLPSCQVALAQDGEVVVDEAFGDATVDTRYSVFSCTKALVAAAMWQLIAEGVVDVGRRVADHLPGFGTNGKDIVTIEQVMLHTSGFPSAPLGPPRWATSAGRREAFGRWRLNWEPGTAYEYHPTSAHWVLAELVIELTGRDYRDVIEERVTRPLGLGRLLGVTGEQSNIATVVSVGSPATPGELEAAVGVRELPVTEVTDEALLRYNQPEVREVGVPGGGGVMRASDLARFYQALLHNPGGLWEREVLADGTGRVRNRLPDRYSGVPANRTLGLVQAGDDGQAAMRGMGRTVSARAFGHNGAGGQVAFADPATGLSFAYCTNGLDANVLRQWRRVGAIASRGGACTEPF
jgi:CubicO group peptidase (beta-lactamase class C family)